MKKYSETIKSLAILITSVALIAIGVSMGQHLGVLSKAVNICLECIGVG